MGSVPAHGTGWASRSLSTLEFCSLGFFWNSRQTSHSVLPWGQWGSSWEKMGILGMVLLQHLAVLPKPWNSWKLPDPCFTARGLAFPGIQPWERTRSEAGSWEQPGIPELFLESRKSWQFLPKIPVWGWVRLLSL